MGRLRDLASMYSKHSKYAWWVGMVSIVTQLEHRVNKLRELLGDGGSVKAERATEGRCA